MVGPENGNFPLLYLGGWVVQKSLKTPLRNIKMAPKGTINHSKKRFRKIAIDVDEIQIGLQKTFAPYSVPVTRSP